MFLMRMIEGKGLMKTLLLSQPFRLRVHFPKFYDELGSIMKKISILSVPEVMLGLKLFELAQNLSYYLVEC
jgi:hypothetical protein